MWKWMPFTLPLLAWACAQPSKAEAQSFLNEDPLPPNTYTSSVSGICGDYGFDVVYTNIRTEPTQRLSKSEIDDVTVTFEGKKLGEFSQAIDLDSDDRIVAVTPRCKATSSFLELQFLIRRAHRTGGQWAFEGRRESISFSDDERIEPNFKSEDQHPDLKNRSSIPLGAID